MRKWIQMDNVSLMFKEFAKLIHVHPYAKVAMKMTLKVVYHAPEEQYYE
jgi:hypothetical protein